MTDEAYVDEIACPIGLSLDVLGQKWTLLIIRESMRGVDRFSDFHDALACPKNLLATRLRMLCDYGILRIVELPVSGERMRHRYVLTESGRELAPTLIALFDWGERHRATSGMNLVEATLCPCGASVHARVVCERGHDIGDFQDLDFPALPKLAGAAH